MHTDCRLWIRWGGKQDMPIPATKDENVPIPVTKDENMPIPAAKASSEVRLRF